MNFPIIEPLSALAALAAGGVLMAHVKAKGSSVLLHHGSHGRLLANPAWNRRIAEAVGIVCMSISFDEYRRVHVKHHRHQAFAQPGLDDEADALLAEGFTPGRPLAELRRLLWTRPFSLRWQARQAAARLSGTFLQGPPGRRVAAWGLWGGAAVAAGLTGWLPGYVGVVGLLLAAGSTGSYLELVSRHIWGITPPSTGLARQLDLSHWRLPSPALPARWGVGSALRFGADVLRKLLWRVAVTPTDLTHHAPHHLAWDARPHAGQPAWTDAALAFSDRLRADPALRAHVQGSLRGAIDAWLQALAKAAPLPR